MNQILSTNNNNNYRKSDTKKIIIIFCIAVILIACIIIAVALLSKKEDIGEYSAPEIEIVQDEKNVNISISCQEGLEYVEYSWNDGNSLSYKMCPAT